MSEYPSFPDNLYVHRRDDKVLLFNPDIPAWLVTNANGHAILSLFDGTHSVDEVVEAFCVVHGENLRQALAEFLHKAVATGIFDRPRPGETPILATCYHLSALQLSLSARCNLNCRYCYATDRVEQGARKMTLDDYRRLLDDVKALTPSLRLTLTGGEPLLNRDCFAIARYARDKGFFVDMLTNGTLIGEDNIDSIKDSFDEIRISLDGSTAELHERFRGQGSYLPVMRALALLDSRAVPYSLSMTVNRLNIHDLPAMAAKYGSRLNFAPLFPAGNAKQGEDISITGREYFQALKAAAGVTPLSYCESSLDNARQCRNCKCSIGDSSLSLSPTGDLYPCHLLHYPRFLIGNVLQTPLGELYRSSAVIERCRHLTVDNVEGCRDCFLRYVCGGACRARAFHEGDDLAATSDFCEYERLAYIDGLFSLYSRNALSSPFPITVNQ
jgi:radical SAM protein with 4Fe4S-binding SPASM domain